MNETSPARLCRAAPLGRPAASLAAPWIALALYVGGALIWFVPDRRIERLLTSGSADQGMESDG
jgi:hypothetical protein